MGKNAFIGLIIFFIALFSFLTFVVDVFNLFEIGEEGMEEAENKNPQGIAWSIYDMVWFLLYFALGSTVVGIIVLFLKKAR